MKQEYIQSSEDVLQELGVTAGGLTTAEAQQRLEKYGPNKLKDAEKATLLQRFLEQLKDPMLIILMIAAGVSAVTNIIAGESLAEVFIILIVVLLNAVLGVFQVAFGYIFLTIGLRTTPPVTASLVSGIEPVLNPILVAVFYHEYIGPMSFVGAVIVVGSVIVYNALLARNQSELPT